MAISTDGAAPVFGQAIRTRIETLLPETLKAWARAAKDWRPAVQARELPFALRRAFWELFTARAMSESGRLPEEADRAELFASLERIEAAPGRGRVSLVGAGPGDPELLTLKAIRALQSADIILYDDLVSPGVLELARREAKRMMVGKTGYGPSVKQSDINALIVSLAGQGKHVVRLKGGDPGIFGRAGEEIEACRAAGLPVTIVPGISAAQGAAATLGVSLTHRDHARRLQFVTGHARSGELPEDLDWRAMADPAATTVIYMARATLAGFRDRALAAGLDPATRPSPSSRRRGRTSSICAPPSPPCPSGLRSCQGRPRSGPGRPCAGPGRGRRFGRGAAAPRLTSLRATVSPHADRAAMPIGEAGSRGREIMKARARWVEGMAFMGESGSGHAVVMDGAPEYGGRNLGIRPMEMLLIGLAGCTGFDVVQILKKGREPITGCEVEVEAQRATEDPKVFTQIHLAYRISGAACRGPRRSGP